MACDHLGQLVAAKSVSNDVIGDTDYCLGPERDDRRVAASQGSLVGILACHKYLPSATLYSASHLAHDRSRNTARITKSTEGLVKSKLQVLLTFLLSYREPDCSSSAVSRLRRSWLSNELDSVSSPGDLSASLQTAAPTAHSHQNCCFPAKIAQSSSREQLQPPEQQQQQQE